MSLNQAIKPCAIVLLVAIIALCGDSSAQTPAALDSLNVLIGKWVGEGTSEVGAGGGYFTFEKSLNGRVLIRKNRADYPATKDRPAVTHEDLMVVYPDSAARQLRGFYTDSEGNTINYLITVSADRKTITFLSDGRDPGPRYRLTYLLTTPDNITLTFEIATADKPDQFRKIIEGKVHKTK
jgi:hypothetical protein